LIVPYLTRVFGAPARQWLPAHRKLTRYLLGELTEAGQAALERELLIDRGKFDRVWAVESELIDSYVRGEMSRPDHERFEGHYLASPLHRERVAIAESFLADIDQAERAR
jgi:hypothetical protein